MIIEYAGLMLNQDSPDAHGCYWYVTEFEGWDGVEVRQQTVDPTSQDGTIVAQGLLGGRALGVTVLCKAPNTTEFWWAWNYLLDNSNNLYDTQDFIVHEGSVRKKVGVVTTDKVGIRMIGVCAFEANLPLMAPDPAKMVV